MPIADSTRILALGRHVDLQVGTEPDGKPVTKRYTLRCTLQSTMLMEFRWGSVQAALDRLPDLLDPTTPEPYGVDVPAAERRMPRGQMLVLLLTLLLSHENDGNGVDETTVAHGIDASQHEQLATLVDAVIKEGTPGADHPNLERETNFRGASRGRSSTTSRRSSSDAATASSAA